MLALVNGMDGVKLPNLMDGKEYKGHTKNKGIMLGGAAAPTAVPLHTGIG